MSEAKLEQAMAALRLHLDGDALLTPEDVSNIAGEQAEEAIERLFENGQVAKTLAGGFVFYSGAEGIAKTNDAK